MNTPPDSPTPAAEGTPTPRTSRHAGIAISHPHFAPVIVEMAALETELTSTQQALAEARREAQEQRAHVNSAAQIADAVNECVTRWIGMVAKDKISFSDFAHRQAAEINLRQLEEMSWELRNPGSTKWGTTDSQANYKSSQAQLSTLRQQNEALRRDGERLDWLERQTIDKCMGVMRELPSLPGRHTFTVRQAIDAAMRPSATKE